MTEDDVMKLLKQEIKKAGNQRRWSLANNISPSYLNDVLQRRTSPGPQILNVLGIEVAGTVTTYRKARK